MNKSPLQAMKALLTPGTDLEVTNHYITREDHACFGTNGRTVTKTNSASWYYGGSPWPLKWPKASDVKQTSPNTFDVYGHPHAGDLYLTVTVVATPEMKVLADQIEADECSYRYTGGQLCGFAEWWHDNSSHAFQPEGTSCENCDKPNAGPDCFDCGHHQGDPIHAISGQYWG